MRQIIILTFLFYSIAATGQSFDKQKKLKLDSFFDALYANKMSMGSISIYANGKEFYSKTYGIANIKENKELPAENETTVYRIGSVSKVITAYMIMKLEEEGKLSIGQSIDNYFPSLVNSKTTTIEQLLLHKSNLPVYVRVDDLEILRRAKTTDELLAAVNKRKIKIDTSKVNYNNLNYILLGLIVEKATGKTYNDALSGYFKEINKPAIRGVYGGLDHTKNEANSFHLDNDKWVEDFEITPTPISDGSGFLVSNAQTLNNFMVALFNYQLISRSSLEKMLPQEKSRFGYGLMKANFDKHKGFGHTGRIEGFTSAVTYFPEDKISIALLQNGTVYPLNDILILVGSILFDEPFTMPELKKVSIDKGQEDKLTGIYKNEEEGYKVIVDQHKGELRLRIAKGNGLLNKMILNVYPLKDTRLFNPKQGILFDFSEMKDNKYSVCDMRVNGSKLTLKKLQLN